jgi:hypothetical protein
VRPVTGKLGRMNAVKPSIEDLSRQDAARMAELLSKPRGMTVEAWQAQLKLFEQAGRDTASALPWWRRWLPIRS